MLKASAELEYAIFSLSARIFEISLIEV